MSDLTREEKIAIAFDTFKGKWPTPDDDMMSYNYLTGKVSTWHSSQGAKPPILHNFLCSKDEFYRVPIKH